MSAQHTPGPWQWEGHTLAPVNRNPDTSAVHSILDAEGGYGFLGSDHKQTLAELDADRLLIAAAPDLLAALQNAREMIAADRAALVECGAIHGLTKGDDMDNYVVYADGVWLDKDDAEAAGGYDRALAQIDAAFAKATGGAA